MDLDKICAEWREKWLTPCPKCGLLHHIQHECLRCLLSDYRKVGPYVLKQVRQVLPQAKNCVAKTRESIPYWMTRFEVLTENNMLLVEAWIDFDYHVMIKLPFRLETPAK